MICAPALAAPFQWVGDHVRAELPGGVQVVFTTRRGGVAQGPYASLDLAIGDGGHDRAAVATNYELLARELGLGRERIVQGRQVHGTTVAQVAGPQAITDGVDGLVTAEPGLGLLALTADCLPVALAADGAVGMVHAGWRGLAGGVLEEAVGAVRDAGATGPVTAAVGPGAGGCCYEVGDEVHAAFADVPGVRRGRRLDLKAVAAARLGAAGVEVVHDTGLCTLCTDPALFFSHRRDGGVTGRQAGIAWRS